MIDALFREVAVPLMVLSLVRVEFRSLFCVGERSCMEIRISLRASWGRRAIGHHLRALARALTSLQASACFDTKMHARPSRAAEMCSSFLNPDTQSVTFLGS